MWGLIPLEFHGRISREADHMVFSNLVDIVPKFNVGTNPSIYGNNVFGYFEAQAEIRNKWNGLKIMANTRSCIRCTTVAESEVTIPHV